MHNRPHDSFFHAEATLLFRAAAENGDTLAGKAFDVLVDRIICYSCKRWLPRMGLELGNPTVSFVDPSGVKRTMRNGSWDGIVSKRAYFASRDYNGWPRPEEIEHYFLAAPGQRWFFETGNDTAGFDLEGAEDTGHLASTADGRIDVSLELWGNPRFGVLLIWSKWGGGHGQTFTSKGDLTRLREFVRTTHGDLRPVGLFVPYEQAWKAVREFLETEGARSKSIDWIENADLPADTFPEQHAPKWEWRTCTEFAGVITKAWPWPKDLESYFLAPVGKRWFFDAGTDKAIFEMHGVGGTDHLPADEGRIDIKLTLWGHPTLGVLFTWAKSGGVFDDIYASKGDLTRHRERAERVHGGTLPVGLFVPYERAWKALNEFFAMDGALPKSIDWIAERDLPPKLRRKHKR
jgi:immunity protein Imm1 of predicted polymorphic toxin system